MSLLTDYKSEMVQSVDCEINMLKKGNIKCANDFMKFRYQAQIRAYMLDILLAQDSYDQDLVNFLMEEFKELVRYLMVNKCFQKSC